MTTHDFILTLLFNIHGIGAASGIVCHNETVFLVSDNSHYLYEYNIGKTELKKTLLIQGDLSENIPKKLKPDFEAIVANHNELYAFGSGSTKNRNRLAVIDLENQKTTSHDLSRLYREMREKSGITPQEFNIEGAVFLEQWYFFQRGNGIAGRNGVFSVKGDIRQQEFSIEYNEIKLPECNGIPATFTDAVAVNDKIYFLGTSENSNSVYHDGEILGSIVGRLDPATMKVEFTLKISDTHKFEGLAFYKRDNKTISFLLCEDNDSDAQQSGIYQLTLPE